jgi:hypothetical protein
MPREKLSFKKFLESGEVPPADEEAYIVWRFQAILLTEQQAIDALAEYRRGQARRKPLMGSPSPVEDITFPGGEVFRRYSDAQQAQAEAVIAASKPPKPRRKAE